MTRTTFLHSRTESRDADFQDTPAAAEARVALKLAAEGYNASRYGADAGGRLTAAALFTLRGRAIHYYGQLHRIDPRSRLPEDLKELHEHPLVDQMFAQLQVGAMTYSNTRAGMDAHREFTNAAIGELCTAAIRYVQALLEVADRGPTGRRERAHPRHRSVAASHAEDPQGPEDLGDDP